MSDDQVISRGLQCTGLALAPDGAIYGCEWGHTGFKLGNTGSIVKIDDPTAANSRIRTSTHELLAEGPTKRSTQLLVEQLNNLDMRIRLDAQFELVKRNALQLLRQIALDKRQPQMARIHSLWGIGQFTSSKRSIDPAGAAAIGNQLTTLLSDNDPEIRAQSLKVLADVARIFGRVV